MRWAVGCLTAVALAMGCSSHLAPPRSGGGPDAAVDRAPRPSDGPSPIIDAAFDAAIDFLDLGPPGAVCQSGSGCQTGICVDGVCCNTACSGPCVTCSAPGRAGTCFPIATGTAARADGCPAASPATCGMTGSCDGVGGCALYPAATLCAAAACVDATTLKAASTSDGLGTSTPGPTESCAPYTCVDGACFANDCQRNPADCVTRPNRDASLD
jgi:hypothetical protein